MSILARIPLWAWYTFSVAYLYAVTFGFSPLMAADMAISTKAVVIAVFVSVAILFFVEGRNAFSPLGLVLFFGLVTVAFWAAYDQGFRFGYFNYWWQWIGAAFLTIALRWGQVYREITGRVPVQPQGQDDNQDVTV